MQIFVRGTDGKTYVFDVEPSNTILELKQMFCAKLRYNLRNIYCTFNGKCLENDNTLSDYNICKESTIHVIGRSGIGGECPVCSSKSKQLALFVKAFDGITHTIYINADETIASLKEAIGTECKVDPKICTFIYNGKHITYRDTETISQVGILSHGTIYISGRLLSCDIIKPPECSEIMTDRDIIQMLLKQTAQLLEEQRN